MRPKASLKVEFRGKVGRRHRAARRAKGVPRYFPRPVPESCSFCIGGFGKTPLLVRSLAVEAVPVVMPGVLLDLVALAPALAPVMSLFEVSGPRCACAGAMAVAAKREATMRTEITRRLDRMGISSVKGRYGETTGGMDLGSKARRQRNRPVNRKDAVPWMW